MTYQRGNYKDKWRIERHATEIRRQVGVDQIEVLDPMLLVEHLDAELFYFGDLIPYDPVRLSRARAFGIDGVAFTHPETSGSGILLNCGKSVRRQTATLMEDRAHLLLKHAPSQININPVLGLTTRTYHASQENEAYDLGAATLLPKERIQRDISDLKLHASEIAGAHRCSEELVRYRVNRLRLAKRYSAYAKAA